MSSQERLQNLTPRVEEILFLSSTAGASAGVVSRGEVVLKGNYGFRDHALRKAPDSDTLYNIGYLTKSMVAAAAGVQISRGKLHWNTLVSDIVPEFKTSDRNVSDSCNIIDLLAHRTGLPTVNVLGYQGGSKPLVQKDDLLLMINALPPGWKVIGRVSGQLWHEVLRQSIWEPLSMTRTTTSASWREQDNIAEGFSGLEDGKLHAITSQLVDDSSIMGSAGSVCTSVNELLVYYTALMKALGHTTVDRKLDATSNPFREVQTLLSSHAVLTPAPFGLFSETTYALGLARGRLPGKIGVISDNTGLVDDMPIIGNGTTSQIVLYHSGTLSGFYSSVYLMPETESCVISLVNTKSICDSADSIAQLLVGRMLNTEDKHDFVALITESVKAQSLSDDEEMKRGRFIQNTNTYKIVFNSNEPDEIDSFTWPEMGGIKVTFSK
ncbi:MAG: hypothetical protein Q9173_004844 [Seirophora scorigena]